MIPWLSRRSSGDDALVAAVGRLEQMFRSHIAAQQEELRLARSRIEQLEAALVLERDRVRDLGDQVAHLIDQLGELNRAIQAKPPA